MIPFAGLFLIPGSTLLLPLVVTAFPSVLPSTFPQGHRNRDADIIAVFNQLDDTRSGRLELDTCYQLIAALPHTGSTGDGSITARRRRQAGLSEEESAKLRTVLQRMDADGARLHPMHEKPFDLYCSAAFVSRQYIPSHINNSCFLDILCVCVMQPLRHTHTHR
jgi:hypothetical protein